MKPVHKIYIAVATLATIIALTIAIYYFYYLPNKKTTGMKQLSDKGANFIKSKEGLRLKSYKHDGDVWTIGYGHTLGVKQGDTCTKSEADSWFLSDVKTAENVVNKQNLTLSQNQFDALVSFAFNIGIGAFASSNLLKLIKSGASESTIKQWWSTHWISVAGTQLQGLVTRRTEEANLFFA